MNLSRFRFGCALAALFFSQTGVAQHNLETARKAWPDLQIFAPEQIRELNSDLKAALSKRGCRIPVFTRWDGRHNVIRGSFLQPGGQDVAVLCLSGDDMSIIVYRDGTSQSAQEIRKYPADAYRMIYVASPFVLKKKAIRDGTTQRLPQFDHDAIEDGPVGERAETVYFDAGMWINVF